MCVSRICVENKTSPHGYFNSIYATTSYFDRIPPYLTDCRLKTSVQVQVVAIGDGTSKLVFYFITGSF